MEPSPHSPALLELKCKNCGAQLSLMDYSAQLMAARCPQCHTLFAIAGMNHPSQMILRPEVAMPKNFRVEQALHTLKITRRWFGYHAYLILFFAICWNSFVIVWQIIAISSGHWSMSLFGMLHTGVGLFLIYFVVALFINSTVFKTSQHEIVVKSGPLPWKGNLTIASGEIVQLYCVEKISHRKNSSSAHYRVEAVLQGNSRRTIVSGLTDADQALFIEQQIEKYLNLRDVPVVGEYGR